MSASFRTDPEFRDAIADGDDDRAYARERRARTTPTRRRRARDPLLEILFAATGIAGQQPSIGR